MRNLLLLATAATALAVSVSASAQQKLVPAQSDISFTSKQMGVPVDGRFKTFDAQISFDPKQPATAKIGFTVNLGSVSFGAPETEAEVVKPAWFNVAKFPNATFQSTSVKALGGNQFEVLGKLNIKGAAQDVKVPVTLAQSGATTTASGSFQIKRNDFKIGEGEWADTSMVANEVQVKFKIALNGVNKL